jgi:formate dehydrogenase major subunit
VAPPPGEARQDWELLQELGNRLGLGWTYKHPKDVFTEMTEVMPSLKNITWDRLVREEFVTYPCDGPDVPGNEILFAEGFPTADGRAKIVPAGLVPPDEIPDDDYPLVLTTGRMLEHWHTGSMTRRATVLDSLEPEAVASLNPRQLFTMGLQPGDRVKVATRRGEIALNVRSDRDVPEGLVFIPFCFTAAAANMLTNPQLDPFGKIPEFKFCACKVEPLKVHVAAE